MKGNQDINFNEKTVCKIYGKLSAYIKTGHRSILQPEDFAIPCMNYITIFLGDVLRMQWSRRSFGSKITFILCWPS